MGELGAMLGRMLRMALARALGRSPFFQAHMWPIVICALGIPLAWMIYRHHWHKKPAPPPVAPRPSKFAVIQNRAHLSYIDVLARYALDVPAGLKIPVAISIAGLVLAAFMDMTYDFYILLRVLVCLTCVIVAVPLWRSGMAGAWFWTAVGIAVLYNPLLPVHLHQGTWEWLNIATFPVFAALFLIIKPRTVV
jgi:hypothetical protein